MEDDEIFGVKDPVSGEIGWCCILGANAQVYALCMYRGSEGLALYRKLRRDEIDIEQDDVFALQNCLMAEFCDRGEVEKEDLALLKTTVVGVIHIFQGFRMGLVGQHRYHSIVTCPALVADLLETKAPVGSKICWKQTASNGHIHRLPQKA